MRVCIYFNKRVLECVQQGAAGLSYSKTNRQMEHVPMRFEMDLNCIQQTVFV